MILGGLAKISIGLNHAKIKKAESVFSEMTKGKASIHCKTRYIKLLSIH